MTAPLAHPATTWTGRSSPARRFVTRRGIALGSLYWLFWIAGSRRGVASSSVARELDVLGVGALRLVIASSLLVGLIVTFQLAYQLEQFSAVALGAKAVGWFAWRELGPVTVATLVVSRSASSIAGELATMSANAEIDALRAMELDPIKYLVAPRVAALLVAIPALTIIADGLITVGSWMGHTFFLGLNTRFFLEQMHSPAATRDLLIGLAKAILFALILGVVPAYEGLVVDGHGRSIGDASSRAVVYSLLAVLATDTFVNAVFYFIPGLVY